MALAQQESVKGGTLYGPRRVPWIGLSMLVLCGACGGERHGVSGLQTIFTAADFSAVKEGQRPAELTAAMGSLQVLLTDDAGKRFATPVCSAFKIGPGLILTAKHCSAYRGMIFNPYHRVAADGNMTQEFLVFGNMVRYAPQGDLDPRDIALAETEPTLEGPLYLSQTHDFAVYGLAKGSAALMLSALDLNKATDVTAKPALFGYPNGAPLMRAPCRIVARLAEDGLIAHDCAAMGGSSGGLIGDEEGLFPVALHLAGPANNSGEFYNANHRFESIQEFAVSRGCPVVKETGQPAADCLLQKGMNHALSLATVRAELAREAPEVLPQLRQ